MLSLWVVAGCESAPPATEILVVVDSNLELGSELKSLHVEVHERAGSELLTERDLTPEALPMSFSLYPLGGAEALRLVVSGRNPRGDDVVEQQVIARFRDEQRALVSVFLARSCLDQLCRDAKGERTERTCSSGSCGPTSEVPFQAAGEGPLGGYDFDAGGSELPSGSKVDAKAPVLDAGGVEGCQRDEECSAQLGTVEPAGCAVARCLDGVCAFEAADADGDGDRRHVCRASGVELTLGMDCDDTNRAISSREWDGPEGGEHPDRCDQIDNDCNGKVDDGRDGSKSCACDPATDKDVACSQLPDGKEVVWPAGMPVGSCRAGKRSCVDGAWTPCEGLVAPGKVDSCSAANDDSNCNGILGEGCQCTDGATRKCGSETGSCKAGVQTCVKGLWATECKGAVTPKDADSCDADNDDNCNGSANDGCKCLNGATSTCGQVLPALGDCLGRRVTCAGGVWPVATCMAQCNDCPSTNPCTPGTCVDGQATFSCDCPVGSTGDGTKACSPVNDCPEPNPCAPGKCVDENNSFSCECPGGYANDGKTCLLICRSSGTLGMDAGPGLRCGANTHCRTSGDGGVGCECDTNYVLVPGSDPPACQPKD